MRYPSLFLFFLLTALAWPAFATAEVDLSESLPDGLQRLRNSLLFPLAVVFPALAALPAAAACFCGTPRTVRTDSALLLSAFVGLLAGVVSFFAFGVLYTMIHF